MNPLFASLTSIAQILLINVVLSGDNALVIALAARQVPAHQRRSAMLWGIGLAVVLRLGLTLIVAYLLQIPGLRFVGALLLAWIACRLLQEEAEPEEGHGSVSTSLRTAIARIAVADLVMSLDNVVAIAGVSRSDPVQLTIGLVISIALILACSTAILAIMNRFRWMALVGTGVLALTAAGMIAHDISEFRSRGTPSHNPGGLALWQDWSFRLAFMALCMTSARWWPALKKLSLPISPQAAPQECPAEVRSGGYSVNE